MTRHEEITEMQKRYPGYDSSLHSKVKRPEYYGIKAMEPPKEMDFPGTQVEQVLEYIRVFGSITSLEAFQDLGCTRLSARIADLCDRGYSFERTSVTKKNRFGKSVTFTRYALKK